MSFLLSFKGLVQLKEVIWHQDPDQAPLESEDPNPEPYFDYSMLGDFRLKMKLVAPIQYPVPGT